ncbi:hypothetical protein [Desulfogranum marinum]|uniref:site-specific integrase n=1 Tax=Desulfogranum marinum TaxID=453220 RepID=UPI0029C81F74|nr:hypothetical protein [Desulfogranum marinum]
MPKKRTINTWLPKYVFMVNGRVVYRPYIPKGKRDLIATDKQGRLKPPIKLGVPTDTEEKLLRAYIAAKESLEFQADQSKGTLRWLADHYLQSSRFARLKSKSQKDYRNKLLKILDFPVRINRQQAKVGDIQVVQLTKPLLRNLLDKMLEDCLKRGISGKSYVNGQFRILSAMITYGIQYVADLGVDFNPCIGIELHRENTRERYVTDDEFYLQIEFARQHGADYLPVFFLHAYLLAGRSIEIADLKLTSISEEGYTVKRRKGSKTTLILWSKALETAHAEALELHNTRPIDSIHLIPGTSGKKLTESALRSAMTRLKQKMFAAGLQDVYWDLHDLKRKGLSDAEDDRIAGHKSEAMRNRYKVIVEKFKPPK